MQNNMQTLPEQFFDQIEAIIEGKTEKDEMPGV